MFIGREAELRFLEHYYVGEGSRILVVYGQKGVGKTALLKHFAEGKKNTYYLARACAAREQRYQWALELTEKGASIRKYPEYRELFECTLSGENAGKQLLIIDEFHHVLKADDTFMEELVRFLKDESISPVTVLLCTSASGWVENSMIQKIGSLASSLSGLLKVREMKFADMRRIFPAYSLKDSVEVYAALGGIPGLWNSFSDKLSVRDNIIHNILNKESRLYEEMSMYMAEELREPAVYNTLLAAMARGCNKLNDIYAHTGFSRAKISVYLKNLMELDLVEKVFSFESGGYANAQKGIYRIANPYVRFYFRFLFPHQSMLQEMNPQEFYGKTVSNYYPDFVEETYRKICREQLAGSYSFVGEWLGKTGSIDIVAKDAEGYITVAACSYARQMTYEDYEWLLFQLKKAMIKPDSIRLFCEKDFDKKLKLEAASGKVKLQHIIANEG